MENKPDWVKKSINPSITNITEISKMISGYKLHTVCQSAQCPNIYECFSKKTATFMIMGNSCTRNCAFCAVDSGKPQKLDEDEPIKIAEAVKEMGLKYAVITSVTRDDLEDGGSGHFVKVIKEIKKISPNSKIEVLIPDLNGDKKCIREIITQDIFVLNHNVETIKRNYPRIRSMANYETSLNLLKYAKKERPDIYVKSGFMLGLSETMEEINQLLKDLKKHLCDIVTIGQYLNPSKENAKVEKFYTPDEFKGIKKLAESYKFKSVACDVFTRSSYMAADLI